MTAFATISLLNNAAVEQAFTPQSIDSVGVANWLDAGTTFDSKRKVSMSVSLPRNGGTVSRIKQKVTIPVMDSIDTTKKVAEAYVIIEAVIPKLASETIRLDLRAMAKDLLNDAVSTAAYQNLEAIY
jgi:hypothetical protein